MISMILNPYLYTAYRMMECGGASHPIIVWRSVEVKTTLMDGVSVYSSTENVYTDRSVYIVHSPHYVIHCGMQHRHWLVPGKCTGTSSYNWSREVIRPFHSTPIHHPSCGLDSQSYKHHTHYTYFTYNTIHNTPLKGRRYGRKPTHLNGIGS